MLELALASHIRRTMVGGSGYGRHTITIAFAPNYKPERRRPRTSYGMYEAIDTLLFDPSAESDSVGLS